ncbi:MAG: hypothetical protein ACR2NZ_14045 [Rubripirellula sp.]
MFTLTKWIAAPVLAFSLMALSDAPQAEAQNFVISGGGLSLQFGTPYRYPSYYGSSRIRYGHVGYPYSGIHRYRSGYYNYAPSVIYRHGYHYHVQPRHIGPYVGPHRRRHGHH